MNLDIVSSRTLMVQSSFAYSLALPLAALFLTGCGERKILAPEKADRVLAQVRQAHQEGRWSRVVSAARPLIKAHPRTPGSEEAEFLAAEAEERRGHPTAAFRMYETLLREHPASDRIREVSRREFEMASSRYNQGKRKLKGHFWVFGSPLRAVFEASAQHDPYAEQAAYALLMAATCEYDEKHYDEAEAILGRLLADHPRNPWVSQAEFLRAMAAFRQSKGPVYDVVPLRNAEERFQAYLAGHPDGADADAARRMLAVIRDRWAEHDVRAARIYEHIEKPDAATLYYREAVTRYPDSPWTEEARRAQGPGGKP